MPPALLPAALAFDFVGGRAVLGHTTGHAHPSAVAAEGLPVRQPRGPRNHLHPPGDLRLRQPEHLLLATSAQWPDGIQGRHGGGRDGDHGATSSLHIGLGADDGDATAAVVPALHVAPGERLSLGAAQSGVGQRRHQGQVEPGPLGGLLRRFEASTAKAGLDGGGECADLSLGPGQPATSTLQPFNASRTPRSRQGDSWPANSWALAMALVARRRVAMVAPGPSRTAR